MSQPCPLCLHSTPADYWEDKRRKYVQCQRCHLVFAEPGSWPVADTEKAEYDLHENKMDDAGYNQFLARIVEPVTSRTPKSSNVLDFGCGPAPALAEQFRNKGLKVDLYDVFYFPDKTALSKAYQGIVMTEVIEHLHSPNSILTALWHQLEPNGVLAIMTQRVISPEKFKTWQYKNDPTHVCFYSNETFEWLATDLNAKTAEFVGRDMVLLTKGTV